MCVVCWLWIKNAQHGCILLYMRIQHVVFLASILSCVSAYKVHKVLFSKNTFIGKQKTFPFSLICWECYIHQFHIWTIKPLKAPKSPRHSCQIQIELSTLVKGFREPVMLMFGEPVMLVIDSCPHQTVNMAQCNTGNVAGIVLAGQLSRHRVNVIRIKQKKQNKTSFLSSQLHQACNQIPKKSQTTYLVCI